MAKNCQLGPVRIGCDVFTCPVSRDSISTSKPMNGSPRIAIHRRGPTSRFLYGKPPAKQKFGRHLALSQAGVIDTVACESADRPGQEAFRAYLGTVPPNCAPNSKVLGAPLKFLLTVDGSPESMAAFDYVSRLASRRGTKRLSQTSASHGLRLATCVC